VKRFGGERAESSTRAELLVVRAKEIAPRRRLEETAQKVLRLEVVRDRTVRRQELGSAPDLDEV
jgi:hypothetical protein